MSYLQKKNIRGHTYYYYTVTKRIEGKSAKIQQVYLGTPDQIFEKCSSAQEPELPIKTSHLEFGLAAALYRKRSMDYYFVLLLLCKSSDLRENPLHLELKATVPALRNIDSRW